MQSVPCSVTNFDYCNGICKVGNTDTGFSWYTLSFRSCISVKTSTQVQVWKMMQKLQLFRYARLNDQITKKNVHYNQKVVVYSFSFGKVWQFSTLTSLSSYSLINSSHVWLILTMSIWHFCKINTNVKPSFDKFFRWGTVEHPTFGRVPRVVTIKDLKAGTELTCHYMIDMEEAVECYDHLKW